MKKIILLLLTFLISFANFAKDVPPALFVLDDPDDRTLEKVPLSITDLDASVTVHGDLALTEVTLTFENHTDLNLEGEFYYPLPANSAITGYALDINGKMVDGVAVEKEKATRVFEEIKARNIDPGLVEWESSDCFKTRVFPILPKKSRTIRVEFLTEINNSRYVLPLKFKDRIKRFKFQARMLGFKSDRFKVEGCGNNQKVETDERVLISSTVNYEAKNTIPENDIVIKFYHDMKQNKVFCEKSGDVTFFKINDYPEIPDQSPIIPSKINIFWDASGSRVDDRHDLEMKVLRDFFARFAYRAIEVNLIIIRNKTEMTKHFRIKNGDCKSLISFLSDLKYDGGTNLSDFETGNSSHKKADFNFLFSDGLSTFGELCNPNLKSPIYAFSSGKNTNITYLEKITAESFGGYFDLLKNSDIAEEIGVPKLHFISISSRNNDLETWPSSPSNVNGKFSLIGKIERSFAAEIRINYGIKEKIIFTSKHKIHDKNVFHVNILKKYRAMKELEDLMITPRKNREEILKLGLKHKLVTPYTSLIVLESIDQYVQYRIPPPTSKPEMREEYFRRTERKSSPRMDLRQRMNSITDDWKNRIMWWNTEFKYKPGFKYKKFRVYSGYYSEMDFFDSSTTFDDGGGFYTQEFTIRNALVTRIAPDREMDVFDPDDNNVNKIVSPSNVEPNAISIYNKKTPYLNALNNAKSENIRNVYYRYRQEYNNSPAFFLNCSDFFHKRGDTDFAVQVLSNIAEFDMDNVVLQRIIACKLEHMGQLDVAVEVLENAMGLYPEKHDIQRELARMCVKQAELYEYINALKYHMAIKLLYGLVSNPKVDRDMGGLALMDINHILPKAKTAGVKDINIPLSLIQPIEADLRIVISRFTGMKKMNFSIVEPSGERINYRHPLSLTGGFISGGVGPEEYFVRKAMPGTYRIETNFGGDPMEKLLGAVILKIDIYTNFGRENEKHNSAIVHLKKGKRDVVIGEVEIK